jgi:glutamine synthetase
MALSCATAQDVLKTIKDKNVQMIDLRFTDLPGVWQHFSVPPSAVDADALEEGIGFDGSSIRGFQEIQESDMLVVPDPTTAFLDPFTTPERRIFSGASRRQHAGSAQRNGADHGSARHPGRGPPP